MKIPYAPHVELGFYFSELTGDESLQVLFQFLIAQGAAFTGLLSVHANQGSSRSFASIYDHPLTDRTVESTDAVHHLLASEGDRVIQIGLQNAVGVVDGTPEVLTQLSIAESSAATDHHPVAIWADGTAFSFPDIETPTKAKRAGQKVYTAFRKLILGVAPSYAAITVDYGLECPADLTHDSRTYAFTDFYISEDFVGQTGLSTINRKAQGAFQEPLPTGVITCCSQIFSAESIVQRESAYALSESVGRMISSIGKYQ